MFSDKSRLLKIIALGGIVFGLCWYAASAGPKIDIPPAEKLTGQRGLPAPIDTQYTEIMSIDPESATMVLKTEGHEFTASFKEMPSARIGQNLSLSGVVIESDLVEASSWHLHPARPLKYYFSLPAVFFVLYLLFKKYRFNWRKLEFFEKDPNNAKCKIQNA